MWSLDTYHTRMTSATSAYKRWCVLFLSVGRQEDHGRTLISGVLPSPDILVWVLQPCSTSRQWTITDGQDFPCSAACLYGPVVWFTILNTPTCIYPFSRILRPVCFLCNHQSPNLSLPLVPLAQHFCCPHAYAKHKLQAAPHTSQSCLVSKVVPTECRDPDCVNRTGVIC